MLLAQRLKSLFGLFELDPDVMVSQITAFSRQVPLLYIIGNANSVALAYTHFDTAPKLLTLIVPIPMFAICLVRIAVWVGAGNSVFTPDGARKRLRSTVVMTGVLGAVYVTWALSLFPYGNAYAQCHVGFFIATTVIGTIFCLMHLRPAALLLTAVVTIPFVIRFIATGEPVLVAMAIDFLLVVVVMIFILLIYYRDFSRLVRSEKTLAAMSDENFRLANLDSLTGIPNRRSFLRDVANLLENDRRKARDFAFAIIDLDGFKPVNDVYGHAAGDRVLMEIARRLTLHRGQSDIVARLGGDEFGIFLDAAGDASEAMRRCDELSIELGRTIVLANSTARVAASIGVTMCSMEAPALDQLMEQADFALYNAKARRRGTAVLFTEHDEDTIRIESLVEQELRRADLAAEMRLVFQPIVEIGRNRIVAYEALARWNNPLLGEVPPSRFIAVAERAGLMNSLTIILLGKALDALRSWPDSIGVSFNLSGTDIASRGLIEKVAKSIGDSGIRASRMTFEITETALMIDFEEARAALLELKALGARISLDDFGTGYSSLTYVHRLPLDSVKVDRSFVIGIATDKPSRKIVKSIVDLCRSLEVTCVVEGVETDEQLMILRALGCRTMQGYLFGRPANGPVAESDRHAFTTPFVPASARPSLAG